MEVRKQVIPFMIDFRCPVCDKGYMRRTGEILTSNPPQYPHRCNADGCDHVMTFMGISYPYMDYEDTGNIIMQ